MGECHDEEYLTKKMEEMRKKNEEILKRYQEVEQDKKYADEFSNSEKEKRRNMDPEKVVPRAPVARTQRNRTSTETQSNNSLKEMEEKRHHRFSESDGPPPDPNYNFLSDRSRVRNDSSEGNWRNTERNNGSTWGQSRRHHTNYGGSDFKNVKSTMEKQKSSYKRNHADTVQHTGDLTMQMTGRQRIQYEEWKKEREKVDHARISRQRSSDGSWRREWDSHKSFNDKESGNEENEEEVHLNSFQCQNMPERSEDFNRNPGDFSERSQIHSANIDLERLSGNERIFRPIKKSSRVISDGDGRLSVTLTNNIKHSKELESKEARIGKSTQRKKLEVCLPRTKSSSWTFLVSESSCPAPVPSYTHVPKPLYPGWQADNEKNNSKDHSQGKDQEVSMKIGLVNLHNQSKLQTDLSEKINFLSRNEIQTIAMPRGNKLIGTGGTNAKQNCNNECLQNLDNPQYDSDVYYSDESPDKMAEIEILRCSEPCVQEVKRKLTGLKIDEDDDEWEDVSEEEVDGSCGNEV